MNYKKVYDYVHKKIPSYGFSPYRLKTISPILSSIEFSSVLDVGCGKGQVIDWLMDTYPKVTVKGIDISIVAIEKMPDLLDKGIVQQGRAQELPFSDESFDLVLCTDVLEHIPVNDIGQCLQELSRVSKKYVLIEVDKARCRESRVARQKWQRIELHETRQKFEWWLSKLKQHGLDTMKNCEGRHKFWFLCKIPT